MALYSSVGTGDFAQVARLVGVHATGRGQVGGHHVETLDCEDRIEGRVFGAAQIQVAFGYVRRCCQQHPGTALAHLGVGRNARQMRRDGDWLAALASNEPAARRAAVTSIFSHHDNIVAPQESCRLPGARNVAFGGVGHVELGRSAAVLDVVMAEINAVCPQQSAIDFKHGLR